MKRKFEKDTSGVLLICSKNALKRTYADQEFNYSFPEGIMPLVNSGALIAVVTESGEDVKGKLTDEAVGDEKGFSLIGEQKLRVEENDEVFILGHSEFTQICSGKNGDIDSFNFWDTKFSTKKLEAGWYKAFIHGKIPKNGQYLHFIIQLTKTATEPAHEELTKVPAI